MASYSRVLEIFGRDHAPSMQCNHDIHPWEILINGERWPERFEHGIIVYMAEDDDVIRNILDSTKIDVKDRRLEVVNDKERKNHPEIPEKYFSFKKDAIHYTVTSLGHEVGLKTQYPKSSLQRYEIKIRKNSDALKNRHIKRGVNQHSVADMMYDAIKLGFITHAQLVVLSTKMFATSGAGDIMNSYWSVINAPLGDAAALSNERS